MEIINNNQVTPQRLHALLRLVPRLRKPSRESLLNVLQPPDLVDSQEAGKAVYSAALRYRLIVENENGTGHVSLHEDIGKPKNIESSDAYRTFMQKRLVGIASERNDNYLLNFVTAWYAVQNERVFRYKKKDDISQHFNGDMDPRDEEDRLDEGRMFNPTKLNGWLTWASFLGWGWRMAVGRYTLLAPDAHKRIRAALPLLIPDLEEVPISQFADNVAEFCPEMDGGSLFETCWQVSRGAEIRGNRFSLMLSTGLRALHDNGHVELARYADAADIWQLFPAQGHSVHQISHIRLKA
jgi:hypothetical protein